MHHLQHGPTPTGMRYFGPGLYEGTAHRSDEFRHALKNTHRMASVTVCTVACCGVFGWETANNESSNSTGGR